MTEQYSQYLKGYDDYWDDNPCPYDENSPESIQWRKGYDEAMNTDMRCDDIEYFD